MRFLALVLAVLLVAAGVFTLARDARRYRAEREKRRAMAQQARRRPAKPPVLH